MAVNPFLGEADSLDDDNIPFELKGEIETVIFPVVRAAPVRKEKPNSVLIVRGKPNGVLIKRVADKSFELFANEWKNHRNEQQQKQVIEKTTDIISVPKATKTKYIKDLDGHLKDFTTFMIEEISPIDNAFEASLHQIKQTLEIITSSELDTAHLGTVRAMMRDSVLIRTLDFITSKMNLNEDQKKTLMDKYFKSKESAVLQLQQPKK